MTTSLVVVIDEAAAFRSGDDDDLDHYYCSCNEDVALCGADISDALDITGSPESGDTCVVCIDLDDLSCERCGA